jgi:protein-disulfide isomerase
VRMQDQQGGRYLEFHRKLLQNRGPTDKAGAIAAAGEAGLDVKRLELDMAGDEVRATIEESTKLARALGINGTPSYVIGEDVVAGAVGVAALKSKVQSKRQ